MKSHEIESEIQFLFDSVEFGSDRYYDLDKGPEYVCDQIVADIDKQNFSDLKVLVLMVMKSYLKANIFWSFIQIVISVRTKFNRVKQKLDF